MKVIIIYLLIINLITFFMFGIDKWKAKRNAWRIPEKTLLIGAVLGGTIGAFAGMEVFHHKTKHWKFMVGVPACMILHIVLGILYWWYFLL